MNKVSDNKVGKNPMIVKPSNAITLVEVMEPPAANASKRTNCVVSTMPSSTRKVASAVLDISRSSVL